MHEVLGGCKICGRRMLTNGNPLVHRTCDACKAEQRRKPQERCVPQGQASRRQSKNGPAAMRAVWQGHWAPPGWLSTR